MPDFILEADRNLFFFINHTLTNPFFDWIMPFLRTPHNWIPLYIFIIGFCIYRFKQKGLVIIILMALAAGFADFTSAHIVKQSVARLRPCKDPLVVNTDEVRVPCGTGYSFPSTHASDHFTIAVFMILLFRKSWRWIWLWGILWAGSISFAQVYVGVHYPIDVFCGALYGLVVGWLFFWIYEKCLRSMGAQGGMPSVSS